MHTRRTCLGRDIRRAVALALISGGLGLALAACSSPSEPDASPSSTATLEIRTDADASASVQPAEIPREGTRADAALVHAAMSACVAEYGWTVTLNPDGSLSPGDPSLTGNPEFEAVWLACLSDTSTPHLPAGASTD
ncbi:hypothetical protein [Agromyces silvae]|uniref:hypothetical protein n=1 Tax=Agromyces silvae TaxID=3388266 RepID=UPI00280BCF61|nr:hypothetical protein [Agromyces protaetiae]